MEMTTDVQQSETDLASKGTVVHGGKSPQIYFHPGSATLLCVDAKDNKIIEQAHEKLAALLENQKKAQQVLDQLNYDMLTQSGLRPARVYEDPLKKTYEQLNKANEELRNELKSISKDTPEGELLDEGMKDSAIGIMELIPLKKTSGFKSTYVRSDRIKKHWRRYKLSNVDKESGEASFIKYENKEIVTGRDANGREIKKTVRSAKIDTNELKKQLKKVEFTYKWEKELVEDSNIVVFDWAKKMNKGLSWPTESDSPDDESTYHQYVDLSAQAQLMRYSHGAGLSAEFNPLEKKASAKIEGHSSFALGEAKASTSLYIPDRLGVSLLFPGKITPANSQGDVCNMGALRFAITATLSGSVGASLAIELGVEIDGSGEMAKGYGIKGAPSRPTPPQLPGQRQVSLIQPTLPDSKAGGEIGAFAGIQVGGNISGAIEWFDPHPEEDEDIDHNSDKSVVAKEKKFLEIAKLEVGTNFQAGAGGSGVFYITYINSRFRIYCKAALCWGVGAKGSIGFEVDGNSYYAFMKSFLHMLRSVDYQKLEQMMEPGSFQALCAIPLILAAQGVQAAEAMLDNFISVINKLEEDLMQENKRVSLMNSIFENPDQLKYTPPETKGAIIAMLIDTNWVDNMDPRNQNNDILSLNSWKWGPLKKRKQTIFKSLKWVQSKSDFDNVMQHLSPIYAMKKSSADENLIRVLRFLDSGEFDSVISTNYDVKIIDLYNDLPSIADPDEPFKPIPNEKMEVYLAMIERHHSDDTRYA
jgi:hypothetical protein